MLRKTLILIHRGGVYARDFRDICDRVMALDPSITAYALANSEASGPPPSAWRHPALTIALCQAFSLKVQRGPVLANHQVEKLAQHEIFRRNGIASPPVVPFRFGMMLDPILFGELVVLKPGVLHMTSKGNHVQLFRRRRLETLTPAMLPQDHPLRKHPKSFLVQRFIDTGERVRYNRTMTFFGEPMYSLHVVNSAPRPPLSASDEELAAAVITNMGDPARIRSLRSEEDVLALARRVHAAFPDRPILGIDIVREERTGKLFVLECNPGGNTWHFSSEPAAATRAVLGMAPGLTTEEASERGREVMMAQFDAFGTAARILVEKTNSLAA